VFCLVMCNVLLIFVHDYGMPFSTTVGYMINKLVFMLNGAYSLIFYQTPRVRTVHLFILCSNDSTMKGH
jgi:hypothetical protein